MDLASIRQRMEKILTMLREELAELRTGRATPAMLERIMVDAYETKMPLVELAMISVVDASQLLVTPFDATIANEIYRAVSARQDLGLSPIIDNSLIRIKIPPLTGERREELAKVLGQKLETAKIAVRQARHELRSEIKNSAEAGDLNEDERYRAEEDLQKLTDEMNEKIEEIGSLKEKELLGD